MGSGDFVLTVRGVAGASVRAALGSLDVTVVGDVTELRTGEADQAALYRLLRRVEDLGLEVVELHHEP